MILAPARIRRWCACLLVFDLIVLLIAILGTHGLLVPLPRPVTTDFASFYAAGVQANAGVAASVYDPALHALAEQAATMPGIEYIHFFYPPTFLLICAPLARLPYLVAFFVFALSSLLLCLVALRGIVREGPFARDRLWLLPVLAFPPLIWTVAIGQNACLTAALLGLATLLLRQRRDIAAGLVFGCLCYKPHVALLVPVALFAAGRWRAAAAASTAVLAFAVLATGLFGAAAWPAFLHRLACADTGFSEGAVVPFGTMISLYGSARAAGLPAFAAHVLADLLALPLTFCVAWSWRRTRRRPDETALACAVLASGALLVMPVALFYELDTLLIAGCWLLADWRRRAPTAAERSAVAIAWTLGVVAYPMARLVPLPMAASAVLVVFLLALLRQRRNARGDRLPDGKESAGILVTGRRRGREGEQLVAAASSSS